MPKRRIYFYKWDHCQSERDEDGNRREDFNPQKACRDIDLLPFVDGARYQKVGQGSESTCVLVDHGRRYPCMRLGTRRTEILPQVEDQGRISRLQIRQNEGLLEQTHAVFFDNGVVGVEYNFFGPRITRLPHYLYLNFPDLRRIKFGWLINDDATRELDHLRDIRLFRFAIHRSELETISRGSPDLFRGLQASSDFFDAPRVEIHIKQARGRRTALVGRTLDRVRSLVRNPAVRESADILWARGRDDRTEEISPFDFLRDKLAFDLEVESAPRARAVDTGSMYNAIVRAYLDRRDDLENAAYLL